MASVNRRAAALARASSRSASTPSFPPRFSAAKLRVCVATAGGASARAGPAATAATRSASERWSGPRMGLEKDRAVVEVDQHGGVVARGGGVAVRRARVRHPFHARAERERAGELVPCGGPPDVPVLPGERRAGGGRVAIEDPLEVERKLLDRPEVQARDDRPVEPRVQVAVRDVLHADSPPRGLVRQAPPDEELVAERHARRGRAVRLTRRRAGGAGRRAGDGAAEDEGRGGTLVAQGRGGGRGGGNAPPARPPPAR